MAHSKYTNGNAGKKLVRNNRSRTSLYYDRNPEAKKKKLATNKRFASQPEQIKRRAARNKARRLAGNPKGKDVHHKDNNPLNNSKSNLQSMSIKKNRQAALRKGYNI